MEFITISQYFYKLYTAVLIILLLPILAFLTAYFQYTAFEFPAPQSMTMLVQITGVVVFFWLTLIIITFKKIKSIRLAQGLRLKLEKYFYLTIVRYILIALGSLALAYGFLITRDDRFTGIFVLNLILAVAIWPYPSRLCKQMKLRGDEREMVYFKKDKF
jgi:hypothetical protein